MYQVSTKHVYMYAYPCTLYVSMYVCLTLVHIQLSLIAFNPILENLTDDGKAIRCKRRMRESSITLQFHLISEIFLSQYYYVSSLGRSWSNKSHGHFCIHVYTYVYMYAYARRLNVVSTLTLFRIDKALYWRVESNRQALKTVLGCCGRGWINHRARISVFRVCLPVIIISAADDTKWIHAEMIAK